MTRLVPDSAPRDLGLLAGWAATLVGPFVLTFAFLGSSTGLAFAPEVLEGGSIEPWIAAVRSHPTAWKIIMASVTLGFGSMLVAGVATLHLLKDQGWRRYLALSGYLIGIPTTMSCLVGYSSVMLQLELAPAVIPEALVVFASQRMINWLLTSQLWAPFFIVVLGSGFLSWSCLRERLLPRWVCFWGMACAIMATLQLFSGMAPALGIFGLGAGPLHMFWFTLAGISLLLRFRKG